MRRTIGIVLAVTVALLLGVSPTIAVGGWTGPTSVMTTAGSLDSLSLGVDAAGKLHIVGSDEHGLFYRTNAGGHWATLRLAAARDASVDVTAVFDRTGHTYIAWAQGGATDPGIYYLTDLHGGPDHGWPSDATRLVSGDLFTPSLQLRDGRIHLAYLDHSFHVHYRTNASGHWVDTTVGASKTYAAASLALTSTGSARIAVGLPDGRVIIARNTGNATHPRFVLDHVAPAMSASAVYKVQLRLDPHDRPHVVWDLWAPGPGYGGTSSKWGTWFAAWDGSHWTPTSRRHLNREDVVSLRLDSTGRAHILTTSMRFLVESGGGFIKTTLGAGSYGAAMALTVSGKARVVYGSFDHLYLMKER